MMLNGFYRDFEDRYRGSRELIKERLQVYVPFIQPLREQYPGAPALDLGCGRGEWLEVLATVGFTAAGVDLDEGMLSACHDLGLSASKCEAVAHLVTLPDNSQAVVTAFHVVEHISFGQLKLLVSETLRVLKPGGLLIMETPNPENIIVATRNFYLDPTHQRPIPQELLSFVPEYYGFKRVKTIRLQESKELAQCETLSLQDVFQGASPDYAVVAQKEADPALMAFTAIAFEREYGLALETLSARYENAIQLKIHQIEIKAQQAEAAAQQAESAAQSAENRAQQAESAAQSAEHRAQQAESAAQSAESRAQQAESAAQSAESRAQQAESAAQSAENRAQQAESASHQAWMQLQAVSASTSWRITAPLRAFKRILTGDLSPNSRIAISFRSALSNLPGARKTYDLIRDPVGHGIRFVARRPVLKRRLRSYIRQFPAVENWLLERRAAQLRADFSRAWSEKGVVPGSPQATNADFSFKANSQVGQRSVDAILERIRAERRKINGD